MTTPLLVGGLLHGYYADVPIENDDRQLACNGATSRISRPLVFPRLVVPFLFAVVFTWNEFLLALILMLKRAWMLPLRLTGNVTVLVAPVAKARRKD